MTAALADALCSALDAAKAEYDRRPDYSGRGMYGKTTEAVVVGDDQALWRALFVAGADLAGSGDLTRYEPEVGRLRKDNMGSDIVVY